MKELTQLTLQESAKGLRDKSFSSLELTSAYLDRIGKYSDKYNVYLTVTDEEARTEAKKVDEKIAGGKELSPLAGMPVALKDIFNTKGVRTTCGSNMLKNFVPPYDSTVVSKLRDNDFVLLGKTNMDEFACGGSTEHSAFGPTKNPWNEKMVPGGSSGGSAAAVAADLCAYSLGTDTGGSIRQPASLCGVVGLKVTYGRVSRSGVTAMASSWDTIGSFTKSVGDAALVLNAIAGHDLRDATTPQVAVPDYTKNLSKGVKGLRIGVPKEFFEFPDNLREAGGIDPDVEGAVRAAIKEYEKMGATIVDVSLPYTKYAVSVYYVSVPAELSANLARFDGLRFGSHVEKDGANLIEDYYNARGAGFGAEIKRRVMIGTYVLSAGYYDAYYKKSQQVRTLIIRDFERVFKEVDVLMTPSSPTPAFEIGAKVGNPLHMYLADIFTIPVNAAGVPGLSVPCGFSKDKLPIGLQIIGPQFSEDLLFQVGAAYEQSMSWSSQRPDL